MNERATKLQNQQPESQPIDPQLNYQSGFGNEHWSESLPGALPVGRNSPQHCPYGLYAEQLSGSAFTAPRHHNLRSWLYRVRPSVVHQGEFSLDQHTAPLWLSATANAKTVADPSRLPIGQRRWAPIPIPLPHDERLSFIEGIRTFTTAGHVLSSTGIATHVYIMNSPMTDHKHNHRAQYLVNADAETLIVPQQGTLFVVTELGRLEVTPSEIVVIPRGVVFQVNPDPQQDDPRCRGYICENYGAPFELPQLGPIGANCLAYPRDFLSPVAYFVPDPKLDEPCTLWMRWGGQLYQTTTSHCPIDVVAWHGNYTPYKYDLTRFCTIGSISFDHPDPSIFTVLTSPSQAPGVANVDFAIFPDRWLVAEDTFRPPWYHRNIMSEFMGLIDGVYDAKEEGFKPGGVSLHNMMLAHGPDAYGFNKAISSQLDPLKLAGTLAFMFETRIPQHVSPYAATSLTLDPTYANCWSGLKRRFDGTPEPR